MTDTRMEEPIFSMHASKQGQGQNQNQSQKLVEIDFRGANGNGLMPPQNLEAEEAILGGILLDPNAMSRVCDFLCAEAFYLFHHREIYKAALRLHEQNQPTDLMMVCAWLADNNLLEQVGGQSKLVDLVSQQVSAVNIDRYASLVMDKYQRRRLIQIGGELSQLGHEVTEELDEVFDVAEQKVFDLTQKSSGEVEQPIDILLRIYDSLTSGKEKGLPTGLYDLDNLIGGLKRKKLYVLAGRSGIGKTQLAVYLAAVALKAAQPVVFFSAEMERDELMTRILAWESGLDSKKIEEGSLTGEADLSRLMDAVNSLSGVPLYLDDTPGCSLTPVRIRSGIRRAASIYGKPGLIVLDYLQLLGDDSGKTNRVSELDKIANGCKAIAKEFDVPFVALAQINRGVEGQQNKRPAISQLRESGAIEQAADVILLLYRDEYYNPNTHEKGICEINVGKQRGGRTGTIKTLFSPETSRFNSLAQPRDERLNYGLTYDKRTSVSVSVEPDVQVESSANYDF